MQTLKESDEIKDSSDEAFMTDVVEASKEMPVIVDFWAPWCQPCKTLGPALEAAVRANLNKLKLVKIDIDKYPAVANQLRVQSIPAVFAFSNGQPVDGFMGAQTPAQVNAFIKKIIETFGSKGNALETAIETAKEMLDQKDYSRALEIFISLKNEDQSVPEVYAGMIACYIGLSDLASAREVSESIPEALKKDGAVKAAAAQILIAEQTAKAGDLEDLKHKSKKFPNDLDIKFDLAISFIAREENSSAIDIFLSIIKDDPTWKEEKAKVQLIELLDSLGPSSQEGRRGRRLLSSLIFS